MDFHSTKLLLTETEIVMASAAHAPRQPLPRQQAFDDDPVAVPAARKFTTDTLSEWSIADRIDDVELCVSELATNALVHSGADGFLVGLAVADDRLRLEVRDVGSGLPEQQSPGADRATGRGLFLVAECADGWGVERDGQRKVVWAEFKLGSACLAEVKPW
ncbi:Histidine kinase-, DNA gyrase B-, and HSP90-like ATPase [Streptomyces sp. YIM 130001]|uniref:ATP-binding protein n=1 Tax=Streptomyces sp. YIM 130001 TaxID=2259644 RepID=UPI000ED2A502|nr:ATP-binding protein [Streptomyces sp. YIM 130001]RII06965.1 Histidine kinase-, DNA gyrase B-, and HSP90-like ATPase [Streptomyces sp. YIM 130001]